MPRSLSYQAVYQSSDSELEAILATDDTEWNLEVPEDRHTYAAGTVAEVRYEQQRRSDEREQR